MIQKHFRRPLAGVVGVVLIALAVTSGKLTSNRELELASVCIDESPVVGFLIKSGKAAELREGQAVKAYSKFEGYHGAVEHWNVRAEGRYFFVYPYAQREFVNAAQATRSLEIVVTINKSKFQYSGQTEEVFNSLLKTMNGDCRGEIINFPMHDLWGDSE
jgi:hypothetical protein